MSINYDNADNSNASVINTDPILSPKASSSKGNAKKTLHNHKVAQMDFKISYKKTLHGVAQMDLNELQGDFVQKKTKKSKQLKKKICKNETTNRTTVSTVVLPKSKLPSAHDVVVDGHDVKAIY